jgi:antitoxin ParD1/3/4
MPTRNISLTPEQDAFIEEIVESGDYQNASEAVRDALRALQTRRKAELEWLRGELAVGEAAIARGDSVSLESNEIAGFITKLGDEARARVRAKRRRKRKR